MPNIPFKYSRMVEGKLKLGKFGAVVSLILCLSHVSSSIAQKTIHGHVRDMKTGEVLPIANIWVEGSYNGTITNEQGEYVLRLKQVPATILVRYIGYESRRITIIEGSPGEHNILLRPTVIELEPIVVTGEDPAVNIMRKVIQKKLEWRSILQTFKAEAYSRVVLENDSCIVSIWESASEVFWDQQKGFREIIKSKAGTNNVRPEQNFAFASDLSNLYDDNIEIMEFKVIGPTHPKALVYYDFKLDGYRQLDDKTVYDISVTPKSKLQPTFKGRISVLDEAYAVISVDLEPSDSILFPPPIREFNIHFKQQFHNFGQAFWLPVDIQMEGDIKVGFVGLSIPTIKYGQISRLTDYRVNVQLPDTLYKGKKRIHMDSLSVKQDTLFATASRVIPLTEAESGAYESLDSSMTLQKAFKPTGFLARFTQMSISSEETEASITISDRQTKSKNILSGLSPQFRYNRVDGFHLGAKYDRSLFKSFNYKLIGAYKTGLKRWSYQAGINYRWGKEGNGSIDVYYRNGVDTRTLSEHDPWILNSLHALLGSEDYFDYYWNKRWRAYIGYGFNKIRTRVSMGFNSEYHSSIGKTTDFDLLGRNHVQRPNSPIQEGRLRSLWAYVVIGQGHVPWGVIGQNGITFFVEHSSPDFLSSDFSYTRYQLAIDGHFSTFLRRRFLPNGVDFRLVAGTATGMLPIQLFRATDARMGAFSPFGTLRGLRGRPLEGEKYVGLFLEHNFRTVPFELLGLRGLAKAGLGIIIHGAVARTWISDSRKNQLNHLFGYEDEWYREVGFSLNGIFGLARVDFTRRLDRPAFFVGFGVARMF